MKSGAKSAGKEPAGLGASWFCVRTAPKREHIAAAHLGQMIPGIATFNPTLRIRRQTRRGAVWFVEALFPGYLFARFNACESMQAVKHVPGVNTVVSFGPITPTIPEEAIERLRVEFEADLVPEIEDDVQSGDQIVIAAGVFRGLNASVVRALPGSERVRVLLEFLGSVVPVELDRQQILTGKTLPQLLGAAKPSLLNEGQ